MKTGYLPKSVLLLLFMCRSAQAQETDLERWRRLDARQQAVVLALARRAFDTYVLRHEVISSPSNLPDFLKQRAGVFVSAMRRGAPCCCMGTLYPTQPNAALEIIENAVAAAGRDRRFRPIRPAERTKITLIVSIVGAPTPITEAGLSSLDPVRDGLVARADNRCGVVLSGETRLRERMRDWARIRAGAAPGTQVELFRLTDVRFMEGYIAPYE